MQVVGEPGAPLGVVAVFPTGSTGVDVALYICEVLIHSHFCPFPARRGERAMAEDGTDVIKKTLIDHGYLVYRTTANTVHLAELVRDNLMMDALVSVRAGHPRTVRVVVRAQRSDFPSKSDTEQRLFERARTQAASLVARGFQEVSQKVVDVPDPMDPSIVLDIWYQVALERATETDDDLTDALRAAVGVEKVAPR
jgi:hypothetical protein